VPYGLFHCPFFKILHLNICSYIDAYEAIGMIQRVDPAPQPTNPHNQLAAVQPEGALENPCDSIFNLLFQHTMRYNTAII
jgi:hypothetical protein